MENLEKEKVACVTELSFDELTNTNGGSLILACAVLGAAGSVIGACLAISYYAGYYYESCR